MENAIDRMVVDGKNVRNALVAVFALVVGAAMPSFAAEHTVSGAYTLTANEDWTGDSVTLERGATVDLAGHNLAVGVVALGSGSGTATFTDSSAGTGELRFTIPSGATFTKTADIAITGSLALVKDGPGTLLWNGGTLDAAIPITISGGVFKNGVTTADVFGSSGTITVNGTGQFDLNFRSTNGGASPVLNKTFYIEGDGPDGSGAIVNTAASGGYAAHLSHVYMTGDATIGGTARVECRGAGYGISGAGYTLTVKNTESLVLTSGSTSSKNYITCQKVICDGGTLQPCQVNKNATVTLTITEGVTLKNGGTFDNYAYNSGYNRTQGIAPSITVSEGGGILHSSKGWYQLNGPLTVQTGSTLSIPTAAPWYYCAITNETGATMNVAGEFNAIGGIFKNDGTLNHTAGLFVFGHRDNANYPCAVENNGTIRTSGGTFRFNGESSMTGTGTLDLAGGTPSVAGTISGFNGTIRVSGGTATIDNIATFPGTLALADGDVSTSLAGVTCPVVFDLSGKTAPFTIPESWLTLPASKQVTIDLRGRTLAWGEKLLSWESAPSLAFSLAEGSTPLVEKADGLYFGDGDIVPVSATWTGAANNGLFSDVANWTCLDGTNDPVSAFPAASTAITLGADVPQGSWATFDLEHQTGTIDLNGHHAVLQPASGNSPAIAITDTSLDTSHPGELHFFIGEGVVYTNTASFGITGNLSLVKDGPGLFVWGGGTLDAAIPITVSNGIFKLGVTTANVFGSSGTITVNGTGQFDLNYSVENGNSPVLKKTFYIEGDGPDGAGAIVNNATSNKYGNHLEHVVLTGDATIGGISRIDFRGNNYGIDGAGRTLTIKNRGCIAFCGGTAYLTCKDVVVTEGGVFQPCSGCVMNVSGSLYIVNEGIFANYSSKNVTQAFSFPVVADDGGGVIRSDNYWYSLNRPLTVKSGSTLSCTSDAPWYGGAITNETDATLNISGEFSAIGRIFKNDGTVNHTAAKFVLGHRDNANAPCLVENNGTIKTTGGTFIFKAESSMTGTGTLELAGGSPSVAGALSGFTGTIRVSGATATINNIATFPGTLVLADGVVSTSLASVTCGVVFDISDKTETFAVPGSWLTLPSGKEVLVDVGERELQYGDRLLSWTTAPSNVSFKLLGEHKGVLRKDATGVVYEKTKGIVITVR